MKSKIRFLSLKDFLHRVGFVSTREFFKAAVALTFGFFFFYGFALLLGFGIGWLGLPEKLVAYAMGLVILILLVKDQFFAGLKDWPGWCLVLWFGGCAVIGASFVWLPWWAALGVLLAYMAFAEFIGWLDELSDKYVPPQIDTLVLMPPEESVPLSNEALNIQLRHFLRIAHDYVPPLGYSWQKQAEEMRDAILGLVHSAGRWRLFESAEAITLDDVRRWAKGDTMRLISQSWDSGYLYAEEEEQEQEPLFEEFEYRHDRIDTAEQSPFGFEVHGYSRWLSDDEWKPYTFSANQEKCTSCEGTIRRIS